MASFLSKEWVTCLVETLNNNLEYSRAARDFEARILLEVLPTGAFSQVRCLYLDLADGKCRKANVIEDASSVEADYTFSGTYAKWIRIVTGKMDMNQAVFSGEFGLRAEMGKKRELWSNYLRAIYMLGDCMTRVPTDL